MDVLQALWVAAIVGVVLVSIVAIAVVGSVAIAAGYRLVDDARTTGSG